MLNEPPFPIDIKSIGKENVPESVDRLQSGGGVMRCKG